MSSVILVIALILACCAFGVGMACFIKANLPKHMRGEVIEGEDDEITKLKGLLRESIRCLDTTIDTQRHNAVSPDSLANKIRKALEVKDDS